MAYDIPTVEPVLIQAGTTLRFNRSLPDFTADLWALAYALRSHNTSAAPIDITAAANGTGHEITEAAATTADWLAGDYLMIGYVTDLATSLEKHEVYRAMFKVLPDVTNNPTYEWRSYAQQMLDKVEAVLSGRLARDDSSYSINGRTFTAKSDNDLLLVRNYFRSEVARENNGGRRKKILTRFVAPR